MDARARGRSLDPDFVLEAYMAGFFPMADPETGEISWHSPDPRAILPVSGIRISRTLRRFIEKQTLDVRVDTAFETVIRECSKRDETWISDEIIRTYTNLFRKGFAHSVEAYRQNELVGGLYGVSIGGAFFGESMFSRSPNASKVALAFLTGHLRKMSFLLHDIQFMTGHLAGLGAVEVSRRDYMKLLNRALSVPTAF